MDAEQNAHRPDLRSGSSRRDPHVPRAHGTSPGYRRISQERLYPGPVARDLARRNRSRHRDAGPPVYDMRQGILSPSERRESGPLDQMPGRQPTDLALPASSGTLIYLIHGVTGTPLEMRYLAVGLSRQGWNVYCPTLPGHA